MYFPTSQKSKFLSLSLLKANSYPLSLKANSYPYYLHQMDLVQGTAHFRTSVRTGLEIIRGLRGHVSGLAIPHYVIDLPGGKGKVALLPDDVEINGSRLLLRTYTGERVTYQDI